MSMLQCFPVCGHIREAFVDDLTKVGHKPAVPLVVEVPQA